MSMNLPNLSRAQQDTLNRLDFRPLINPDFIENPSNPLWDLDQTCADCLRLDSRPISQPGAGELHIRRRDVEDFCNIWLRNRRWDVSQRNSICGHWRLGDWGASIGHDAMMVVQYKTFRVSVQTGPIEAAILVSTEDIRELLNRYLDAHRAATLPSVVAYFILGTQAFQLLIIPEPENILRESIERFNENGVEDNRTHTTPQWRLVDSDQEIITVEEQTLGAIDAFRTSQHFSHLEQMAQSAYQDKEPVVADRAGRAEANFDANR